MISGSPLFISRVANVPDSRMAAWMLKLFYNMIIILSYPVLDLSDGSFVIPTGLAIVLLVIRRWRFSDLWPRLAQVLNPCAVASFGSEG